MASNGQLPASNGAAHNANFDKPYGGPVEKTAGRRRGMNIIIALLLAISVALSAAPAAGYKSGWVYYRRSAFVVPARLQIPFSLTLKIWVGWIKGSNTVTNILHGLAPSRFPEYRYLRDIRESGQVIGGLSIAFLLLGGLVAFFYLLACLVYTFIGGARRGTTPPGLGIALLIFGALNMLWSIICYIVLAVGTAIYTRRNLDATYVGWPDWCFYLGFFSGVFMWIAAFLALSERRRAKRNMISNPHMTHNMTYNQPHGTTGQPKVAAV